jgi:hypothetical protein
MSTRLTNPSTEIPRQLCKFRTFGAEASRGRDMSVYSMLLGRLHFQHPSRFNDPFEGRPQHRVAFEDPAKQRAAMLEYLIDLSATQGVDPNERTKWSERALASKSSEELIEALNNRELEEDSGSRILCLAHPDTVLKPLLWSHYGDSHRGLCIHFSTAFAPLNLAWQVVYDEEYPTILVPRTAGSNWDIVLRTHLTKCSLWSYEQEYRVVRIRLAGSGLASHLNVQWDEDVAVCNERIAEEVTLGARMARANRDNFLAWVRENAPHLRIWQASLHRHRFAIERREQIR